MVQGRGGMEETAHFFQAEERGEAVLRLGAHEVEGLPVAPQDRGGEKTEATGAKAQGRGGAAIDVFAVQAGGLARRSWHIQCSYPSRPLVKIITLYEPAPRRWVDFKVRRPADEQ